MHHDAAVPHRGETGARSARTMHLATATSTLLKQLPQEAAEAATPVHPSAGVLSRMEEDAASARTMRLVTATSTLPKRHPRRHPTRAGAAHLQGMVPHDQLQHRGGASTTGNSISRTRSLPGGGAATLCTCGKINTPPVTTTPHPYPTPPTHPILVNSESLG